MIKKKTVFLTALGLIFMFLPLLCVGIIRVFSLVGGEQAAMIIPTVLTELACIIIAILILSGEIEIDE